jgi:hypothetical protein
MLWGKGKKSAAVPVQLIAKSFRRLVRGRGVRGSPARSSKCRDGAPPVYEIACTLICIGYLVQLLVEAAKD